MKRIILVTFILLSTLRIVAQDTISIYLNEDYLITPKDSAIYIREAVIKEDRYYLTDKYIDGTICGYYELSSLNPYVLDGLSIDYKENNEYYSKGHYKQGVMTGMWLYYDDIGDVDTVYYEDLKDKKIKRVINFRESEKTKELGYQAIDSLESFLKSNFHLPPRTRENNDSFQVIINCALSKDGRIMWHEIVQNSFHQDINQEIARIMELFQFNNQANKAFEITVALNYNYQPAGDENTAYFIVEEMPDFKNKEYHNSFNAYIQDNISEAFRNCSGIAYVSFVVERDGSLSNIVIKRGIENCDGYEKEIERIFKSSPNWKPGKQRDKPVRVKLTVIVGFGKG